MNNFYLIIRSMCSDAFYVNKTLLLMKQQDVYFSEYSNTYFMLRGEEFYKFYGL